MARLGRHLGKFKWRYLHGGSSNLLRTHSMFAVRKNIVFGISAVTVEVSSCTKFKISQGTTPDPAGGAYSPWRCVFWVLENLGNLVFPSPEKSWKTVLISAPSLGVFYCQQLTLSVCLSVCLSSNCFFFLEPFLAVSSPCGTLQNIVLRFLI